MNKQISLSMIGYRCFIVASWNVIISVQNSELSALARTVVNVACRDILHPHTAFPSWKCKCKPVDVNVPKCNSRSGMSSWNCTVLESSAGSSTATSVVSTQAVQTHNIATLLHCRQMVLPRVARNPRQTELASSQPVAICAPKIAPEMVWSCAGAK